MLPEVNSFFNYELDKHNNGLCDQCDSKLEQTFEHILYRCDKFNDQRQKFRNKLLNLRAKFMYSKIWKKPLNLILPFLNKELKIEKSDTHIYWKHLIDFLNATKLPCFQ